MAMTMVKVARTGWEGTLGEAKGFSSIWHHLAVGWLLAVPVGVCGTPFLGRMGTAGGEHPRASLQPPRRTPLRAYGSCLTPGVPALPFPSTYKSEQN